MSDRPDKKPRWATVDTVSPESGKNNVIEPSESKKNLGWDFREKPSRNFWNWLHRKAHEWIDYFDSAATNPFAPRATDPADMTITVGSGQLFIGGAMVEQGAQVTSVLVAPGGNPRHDIVVVDSQTGVLSVIAGAEAASPVDPSIIIGKLPIARLVMYVGQTSIVVEDITDIRPMHLTQLATTGDPSRAGLVTVSQIVDLICPVGRSILDTTGVNPSTQYPGTTFVQTHRGRAVFGEGTSDQVFAGAATGGASTHQLTQAETPVKSHSHGITDPGHTHGISASVTDGGLNNTHDSGDPTGFNELTQSNTTGISVNAQGDASADAHNNLPPYEVLYVWKRTV